LLLLIINVENIFVEMAIYSFAFIKLKSFVIL